METMVEKEYMCKFCDKKFPCGKSLGGHIRIHSNHYSLHSTSYNGNNKKRLVDQREIFTALVKHQLCCRECGKSFDSLKTLWNHMDSCHCEVMDRQSDTETSSSSPTKKRSKKQSSSESFGNGSACEIEQEHKNSALSLMMMSMDSRGFTLAVNSLVAELSMNSCEILETKVSSGEKLKMIFNVNNQDLETDKVALVVDDDDHGASDSYSSDSEYFMNGPKKSEDSDISVGECFRNTGFRDGDDEFGIFKEGSSKYELRKSSKRAVFLPSYESDSCAADTNSKKAMSANKNSRGHECPICFRVFKSGQALGGHKRSHFLGNHELRVKHKS